MRISLWAMLMGLSSALFLFLRSVRYPFFAYVATSIFILNPFVFAHFHLIILDIPLTFFTTLSLLAFFKAISLPKGLKRRLFVYGFSLSCGLGVLTKGIIALALLGPIALIWVALTKNWHRLFPLYLPTSGLLFLFVVAPWHIMAQLQHGDFFHKYFFVEHWLRYTTSVHKRDQPFWFFIPFLILGFLPWIAPLLLKIKSIIKSKDPLILFSLVWVGWTLAFFSFSHSKLIPYILPIFPALAILGAHALLEQDQNRSALSVFLLIVGLIFIGSGTFINHRELYGSLTYLAYMLGGILIITSFMVRFWPVLPQAFLLGGLGLSLIAHVHLEALQKPSIKPLVAALSQLRYNFDEPVISYGSYLQDLPYYLKDLVYMYENSSELEYGLSQIPSGRFISTWDDLKKLSTQHRALWIVMRRTRFEEEKNNPYWHKKCVWEDKNYVLIRDTITKD